MRARLPTWPVMADSAIFYGRFDEAGGATNAVAPASNHGLRRSNG